ncbi:MAG: hypothetical protein ABSA57_06245 [Candidatus Acidiferrales bacterium]|jgi:hypothetical protein
MNVSASTRGPESPQLPTNGGLIRAKLIGMRDTMIALSLQSFLRFVMLLRSWNY